MLETRNLYHSLQRYEDEENNLFFTPKKAITFLVLVINWLLIISQGEAVF